MKWSEFPPIDSEGRGLGRSVSVRLPRSRSDVPSRKQLVTQRHGAREKPGKTGSPHCEIVNPPVRCLSPIITNDCLGVDDKADVENTLGVKF